MARTKPYEGETSCHCGCGFDLTPLAKTRLKRFCRVLARYTTIRLEVASGARCRKHNLSVDGATDSAHTHGEAIDCAIIDSVHRYDVVYAAMMCHFAQIGVYKDSGHVHIYLAPRLTESVGNLLFVK
jgi:uncharacterized protein YcbK (DUF882 family)